jgi:exodeoxyribonuclease-3
VCGDFNVAPEERDVWDPSCGRGRPSSRSRRRAALKRAAEFGLEDTFRSSIPEPGRYSWWDYRMLGFQKNRGLRLDHIYATAPLARRLQAAGIDRRRGRGPSRRTTPRSGPGSGVPGAGVPSDRFE